MNRDYYSLFLKNQVNNGLLLERGFSNALPRLGKLLTREESAFSCIFTNLEFLSSWLTLYFPCLRQVWVIFKQLINPQVFIC